MRLFRALKATIKKTPEQQQKHCFSKHWILNAHHSHVQSICHLRSQTKEPMSDQQSTACLLHNPASHNHCWAPSPWRQKRSLTPQGSFSMSRCLHAFQINLPPTDTMQRMKSLLQSLYPTKIFKYNYTVSEKIWTKCKGKMYTNFSSKRNYSSEISQLHKELTEIIRIRWQSSYPD